MVEDRSPRQADGLFQPAPRRLLVAIFGKAATGAVEDLTATGRQMVLADLGHKRSGLVRPEHVSQHVLQDAAVAIVVRSTPGFYPPPSVELDSVRTLPAGLDVHRLWRLAVVERLDAGDVEYLGAVQTQRLGGLALGELQRDHPHADQVGPVDALERLGDHRSYAQ